MVAIHYNAPYIIKGNVYALNLEVRYLPHYNVCAPCNTRGPL